MMILTNERERTRFVRFTVVGSLGFVVDFVSFNLLTYLVSMPPLVASALAFVAAVTSNFYWNRHWTYPDSRSKAITRQLSEFFAVNAMGLLLRTLIFATVQTPLLVSFSRFSMSYSLPLGFLAHNLALAVAVGVVMFWNFYVNRIWTYADVESP